MYSHHITSQAVPCWRRHMRRWSAAPARMYSAGDEGQETVHLAQLSPASYHAVISDTPALVCGRIQPGIHQHYEHHIEIFSFVSAERGCLTLIRYVILLHKQVMK